MPICFRKNLLVSVFVFFGVALGNAQTKLDSLKTEFARKPIHDTTKLVIISQLIDNLYESKEVKGFNELMGKIAKDNLQKNSGNPILHKKYTMYLAAYYNNLSFQYDQYNDSRALPTLNKSLALYRSIKADDEYYSTLVSKGLLLTRTKQFKEAIDCYYKALKYFELNENENMDGISYVNSNLGVLYSEQNQYAEAIKYLKKAILYIDKKKEVPTVEDELQKCTMYYNIGYAYITLKNYEQALFHLNQALLLSRKHGQNSYTSYALGKLGLIDLHFKRFDAAEQKLIEAYGTAENNTSKASTSVRLGEVYYYKKDYNKALRFVQEGLQLNQSIDKPDIFSLSYELLHKIYKAKGDYKNAMYYLEKSYAMNDALKIEESKNELKQQQLQYNYEKRVLNFQLQSQKETAAKNNLLILLSSALFLLLLGSYFLYRTYKQKQTISIFEKNELKQKLLLTQMNPHFIFNSIDNIQGLIYNGRKEEAVNYLTKFSKFTRQILENSSENYIPFQEELAMIDNYLVIQQLLYAGKFNFSISVAEGIDQESILIPPMLTQPFIENAIKHGLKNKPDNGFINIHFYLKAGQLFFEITDNGEGFGANKKVTGKKSMAMKITKERLANIAKKSDFGVHAQNLKDDRQKVIGAKVFFEIPYIYEN